MKLLWRLRRLPPISYSHTANRRLFSRFLGIPTPFQPPGSLPFPPLFSVSPAACTWRKLSTSRTSWSELEEMASGGRERAISSLTSAHLQVLGTGGGELGPSLFLFTDTRRYLFNCCENMQRFSNEHKVRYSKVRHVFLTKMSWANVGGLCGLVHHLSSYSEAAAVGPFCLHGSDGLAEFITCSRFQLGRDKVKLQTNDDLESVEGIPLPVYRDENLTIHTLNLSADGPDSIPVRSRSSSPQPDSPRSGSPSSPARDKNSPNPKRQRMSSPSRSSTSVFLCKLVDVPGKFNPQRAAELGLPPSPKYRQLVQGDSVVAPNGRVIQPSDVLGPTRVGPTFVVLECPHEGLVPSITSHPLLQREAFQKTGQNLALVVHITPKHIMESRKYAQWMTNLGPDTDHLLLHKTVCSNDWFLRGFLNTHGPLNVVCPSIFKMLPPAAQNDSPEPLNINSVSPERLIVGQTLLRYQLKPSEKAGIDTTQVLQSFDSHKNDLMQKIMSSRDVQRALKKIPKGNTSSSPSKSTSDSPSLSRSPSPSPSSSSAALPSKKDLAVTFLGTGASCPSRYRNVSGILLQTGGPSGNVLLDCGEGTLSQLYRHFGREEGDQILAGLGRVFISHMHGDHNLGLISVLSRRAEVLRANKGTSPSLARTVVLGPKILLWWLTEYRKTCESINFEFVECSKYISNPGILGNDEHLHFQTVPVDHCKQAYGVVVDQGGQWKVVYSGDTRPCPELVRVGKNATLLLHEATLDDDLLADALEKKHCTISEALEVARKMSPDFTILTHFSQRYCKIIPSILSKPGIHSKVFIAFDHMTVPLSEMHRLPTLLPAVQEIISNTVEEEEMMGYAVAHQW